MRKFLAAASAILFGMLLAGSALALLNFASQMPKNAKAAASSAHASV
jgi:hypothetical protein